MKLLAYVKAEGKCNLVLEFMSGGSLRDLMNSRKKAKLVYNENDLLHTFMDIAVGVKYIHDYNIIHRDLKPGNILVDGSNRLKISDFGLSKLLSPENVDQSNHTVIRGGIYMASERNRGQAYEKSCDVWSLGVILYELATGKTVREDSKFQCC